MKKVLNFFKHPITTRSIILILLFVAWVYSLFMYTFYESVVILGIIYIYSEVTYISANVKVNIEVEKLKEQWVDIAVQEVIKKFNIKQ